MTLIQFEWDGWFVRFERDIFVGQLKNLTISCSESDPDKITILFRLAQP